MLYVKVGENNVHSVNKLSPLKSLNCSVHSKGFIINFVAITVVRVPPWTGAQRTTYTATSKINVKTEMWTAIHWPDGKNRKWNTCTVQRPSVLIRWTRNGAIQQLESFSRWPHRNVYKRDQLNAPGGRRKPQSNNNQLGKTQRCRNWDWGPQACDQCPAKKQTCHYCQDLAKVCLSNLRKKSVHKNWSF